MVTGAYRITVDAPTRLDAKDIAQRRAREDGWRPVEVSSCKQDALGRWAVVITVEKA